MFNYINENQLLDAANEHLKNSIKQVIIADIPEPTETYEVTNQEGELFIKSLGVTQSAEVAKTLLGNGFQDFIYGVQIVIATPTAETERAILDLSYEVRRAMSELYIDELATFNDGFKLTNTQPVTYDAGNYQAKVMTFNVTITEEV